MYYNHCTGTGNDMAYPHLWLIVLFYICKVFNHTPNIIKSLATNKSDFLCKPLSFVLSAFIHSFSSC